MELLLKTPRVAGADFEVRLFNADGGETPISGNGTRCVAAYLYLVEKWDKPEVRIATGAGVKIVKPVDRRGDGFVFETEMGAPRFASDEIPVVLPARLERVIRQPLDVDSERIEFTATSMGNPHCSVFVDDFESIDWREIGAKIETHAAFPERANVEFVRVINRDEIEVRFWERGCGETLASGTGACGAALAAMINNLTERKIKVITAAGELIVEWRADDEVVQTGEARAVYRGEWLLEE
jgi:diaminopimelate epimerase